MEFERIYRHGDVLLFKIKENISLLDKLKGFIHSNKTSTASNKKSQKIILEVGEVTGHAHKLEGDVEVVLKNEKENKLTFRVFERAILTHEEHAAIVLDKGLYIKVSQVEYDPFTDLIVRIKD